MVFQRLHIAGLLAAVLALPSCDSDEPQRVAISLGVDADSCGTDSSFTIRCQSELRVSVEGANGQILSSDCVTLAENQSIETIGQLLSTSSNLGTLATDQPLRITLKVYEGEGSCQIDVPNVVPYIEGTTPLVTLGEVNGTVSLLLRCSEPVGGNPTGVTGEECENCGADLAQCFADIGVSDCQAVQSSCEEECQAQTQLNCEIFCGLTSEYCQDGNGDGLQLDCSGLSKNCRQQCEPDNGEDGCDAMCKAIDSNCNNSSNAITACQEQSQNCPEQCDPQNSCLSL